MYASKKLTGDGVGVELGHGDAELKNKVEATAGEVGAVLDYLDEEGSASRIDASDELRVNNDKVASGKLNHLLVQEGDTIVLDKLSDRSILLMPLINEVDKRVDFKVGEQDVK